MIDRKPKPSRPEAESLPDAWERFERAVDVVIKAKPKPRATKAVKRKRAPKNDST